MLYCAIAYAACGIIAFGHCAANIYAVQTEEYHRCQANPKNVCFTDRTASASSGAMVAAILWPLYLSWEMQS